METNNSVIIKESSTPSLIEYLYLITIVINIFLRSMFHFGTFVIYMSYVPIMIAMFICLIKKYISYKRIIWLATGSIISIGTHSLQCLFIILVLFIAPNINLNKITKRIIFAVFGSLFIIYLSTLVGLIPNLILVRNGVSRMAMGTQFPLVFSTYIFYASIYITLLLYKKHPIKLSMLLIFIVLILDRITNSRNDELCIILLVGVVLLSKANELIKKIIFYLSYVVTFLLIILSIFITQILPYVSNLYINLDKLLSGRLSLQSILFSYYRPLLFGQEIYQHGFGGEQTVSNYFYIDNSYIRILFMYGIIFFVFFIATVALRILKYGNNGQYIIGIILLIILISGISADSLSLLTQSILVLPLFFINKGKTNI